MTTITTIHDVETEMTRVIYLLDAHGETIMSLGREAQEIWRTMSSNDTSLAHLGHQQTRGGYTVNRLMKVTRGDMPKVDVPWAWASKMAEFVAIEAGDMVWKPDATEHPDFAVWQEVLAFSHTAKDAMQAYREAAAEYDRLANWANKNRVATQNMHGWYGRVKNTRRSVTGWIVKGRGQTVYVLPDPLKDQTVLPVPGTTSHRRIKPTMVGRGIFNARVPWGRVTETHVGNDAMLEKFNRDNAGITLYLPPIEASERRSAILALLRSMNECLPEAEKAHADYVEWEKVSGAAISRQRKIEDATKDVMSWSPDPGQFTAYSMSDKFRKAVLKTLDQETLQAVIQAMLDDRIDLLGGPLTEDEKKALAVKPPNGASDLELAAARVLKSRVPDLHGLHF